MNELQKAAEILVECGYAEKSYRNSGNILVSGVPKKLQVQVCNPFLDTLGGRRQLDAIENWLHKNKQSLLIMCKDSLIPQRLSEYDGRVKMLERIDWCLQELIK